MNESWLQIGLTLLTTVPGIVAQVEAANPNVPGEGKKLIVMDQIKTALVDAEPVIGPLLAGDPTILAGFSVAVDVAVDIYNRSLALVQAQPAAASAAARIGSAPTPATSAPAAQPTTASALIAAEAAKLTTGAQ